MKTSSKEIKAPTVIESLCTPLGVAELLVLLARYPELKDQPKGKGEKVILLPGLMADDVSTLPLRAYLTYLGYNTQGWKLGMNLGFQEHYIKKVRGQIEDHHLKTGEDVVLIGWSMGGLYARELAREIPHLVREVITLGTPLIGGAKYTGMKWLDKLGFDLDSVERELQQLGRSPLDIPLTIIYSKTDGMVAWEAALDSDHDHAEHFEVTSNHIGLGLDIDVFKIIAAQLAEHRVQLGRGE